MAGRHRRPPSKGGQGRHRRPQQRRRLVAPALGSVLVLGAGGIAAAAAITGGNGPGVHPEQVVTSSPAPVSTVTPVPTSPTPAPSPTRSVTPKPDRPAPALVIHVTGRVSWVEATRPGGRVLYSGLLRHGRDVVVRAGPVSVTIGDAGAVRLSRHGHVTDPAGRPGEVRVVRVS